MLFSRPQKSTLPAPGAALPGRDAPLCTATSHLVNGNPLRGPWPPGHQAVLLGLGCFWGAERLFWQVPGVWVTSVGYAAGQTPNPSYEEVCSGGTGHAEVVQVVFDPARVSLDALLRLFWESHDPTQGMRQGNDVGTQYRSMILASSPEQAEVARASAAAYGAELAAAGMGPITTEIAMAGEYYLAEDYHQQYLHRNPGGYCGLRGTGVSCPIAPAL